MTGPVTPIYGWPYHALTDPPDGADLGEDLALAIEATVSGLDVRADAGDARLTALEADTANIQAGDSAWQTPTLLNSWVNAGAGFMTARYRLLPTGQVEMQGLVSSGVIGQVIFVLPAAYRPSLSHIFAVVTNNTIGRVVVDAATGNVNCDVGNNTYVSLSGIAFSVP